MSKPSPSLSRSSSSSNIDEDDDDATIFSEGTDIILFRCCNQRTWRKCITTQGWICMGNRGTRELAITQPRDIKYQACIRLKDSSSFQSGREPPINAVIANIRASYDQRNSKTIHWLVKNEAHYKHPRSFVTRFTHLEDAVRFLLLFNGSVVEVEKRLSSGTETATLVTKNAVKEATEKSAAAVDPATAEADGGRPKNKNEIDNGGDTFVKDDETVSEYEDDEDDDKEHSVDLLASQKLSHSPVDNGQYEADDEEEFCNHFEPTQAWPEDHKEEMERLYAGFQGALWARPTTYLKQNYISQPALQHTDTAACN